MVKGHTHQELPNAKRSGLVECQGIRSGSRDGGDALRICVVLNERVTPKRECGEAGFLVDERHIQQRDFLAADDAREASPDGEG